MLTCRLCGACQSVAIRKGVRLAQEVEIRRCTSCNLVFLWPMPDEPMLSGYYADDYRRDYDEPSVSERFKADMDEARSRVRRLLPMLTDQIQLLEIGAGSGAFLDAVRPYVSVADGVEPDRASRKWIQGLGGHRVFSDLNEIGERAAKYDLIVSFHVLEHVPSPLRFLGQVRPILRSSATLVLEVPNVDDALVGVYQIPAYLDFYYQKAHLFYFSAHTLSSALGRAGYEAHIEGVQRYDLSNHIRWMLTGQPGGQGYYGNTLGQAVNAAYAESLIRSGHSDTLWATARIRG